MSSDARSLSMRSAFTLVELSIVLVILGLLIGGVLTGQSLIRAAELRSVSTQYARYIAAVHTFRDKYFALPGDMTNATAYWGIAGGTGSDSTCRSTASTDAKTCNGDGNGQLAYAAGSNEQFRAWQHLANAGLIEGSYDGIAHGGTSSSTTAANAPAGRISSSYWSTAYVGPQASDPNVFDGEYGNAILVGALIVNSIAGNPILKAEEAYNVDKKLDDGRPATGKVRMRATFGVTNCTDTSSSAALTANYLLTNAAIACALYFPQAY